MSQQPDARPDLDRNRDDVADSSPASKNAGNEADAAHAAAQAVKPDVADSPPGSDEAPTTRAASADQVDERSKQIAKASPETAVALIIAEAARRGASDLFVITEANHAVVRIRHMGIVQTLADLSAEMGRRMISHIKAMARMDVAEHRRPLDGRWVINMPELGDLDLRVNTMPTLHGEDCAMRILKRESILRPLTQLGLLRSQRSLVMQPLTVAGGMVLVTGPTGSGKTTTLYSCLSHLNDGARRISTIEDPIEFAVPGLQQCQVNAKLDLDFPDLLRSVLRQSPDVIMIGEIRDETTATTAVRAANSGHLVLATLHAPVAAGAVQIMRSFGVNPNFLASSLQLVIAQRLVRVLCPDCRIGFDLSDAPGAFEDVKEHLEADQPPRIFGPGGCDKCFGSGYRGREGIFEVMPISVKMRRLIADGASARQIEAAGRDDGMLRFRQAALIAVAQGRTSIEEIMRVVPTEFLGEDEPVD